MKSDFQVSGTNPSALFTLKLHRGDGMALVAMNWRQGKPPKDFVGFAIEYKEPEGDRFFPLKNRIAFPGSGGEVLPNQLSTRLSPIQKFRWVHFPRNAELRGEFTYRVTPVFMNAADELSYGESQEAALELRRETYPGKLNVSYTRGFVSSQAFVDRYGAGAIPTLLPAKAEGGLDFVPTHPKAAEALAWMGFEARSAIIEILDQAVADATAQVRVVAYDLSEPAVVSRLEKLGPRLKIIIDDAGEHGKAAAGETRAAARLALTAGAGNVKRQHLGGLQHNKTIVVDGRSPVVLFGSTNYTWRGLYVQNNNAVVVRAKRAVRAFLDAFEAYWQNDAAKGFAATGPARWHDLGVRGIDAQVGFSPRGKPNAALAAIARDIAGATSNLFFSLAFLYQTDGPIRDAVKNIRDDDSVFTYGISDRPVGGLDVQKPNGQVVVVSPSALGKKLPPPFKPEPTGGSGVRLHHKFIVIDFDRPTARVYTGSYNFSDAADTSNGENLVLIRDRRIAVSYVVEALRIFDHYHFRAVTAQKKLQLARPPRKPGDKPWWSEDYSDPRKMRDRELFA